MREIYKKCVPNEPFEKAVIGFTKSGKLLTRFLISSRMFSIVNEELTNHPDSKLPICTLIFLTTLAYSYFDV